MMHLTLSSILFLILVLCLSFPFIQKWKKRPNEGKLPPGPWKLPLIGNLHQLMGSELTHRTLQKLAQKHGDLMHIQLGEISAIVASSPRTAKDILKTHDPAFAARPYFLGGKILFPNNSDIFFCPYSDYWKQRRKICTMELLSPKMVRSFGSIRQAEISKLVSSIREEALASKQGVNLTQKFSSYLSSMLCGAAFGQPFGRHRHTELLQLMREAISMMSGFYVCDVFPSWKILNIFSRSKSRLLELRDKIDEILDAIIQEHVENPSGRNGEFGQEDLIDALLRIKQSPDFQLPITDTHIKSILLDMFGGATDTSVIAMEWAMAELIRNPNVMAKAQDEIRKALITENKTTIEETHIQNLSYLKLVIKETLRIHPPGALIFRECMERCEIDGYIIPPDTRVFINFGAIGRDPKYWDDAESFRPERFETNGADFTGSIPEYIPFGAGKRVCPGISFGLANLEVLLANLLYYFDWKLTNDTKYNDLDMTEADGATVGRKNHLYLVPSVYQPLDW